MKRNPLFIGIVLAAALGTMIVLFVLQPALESYGAARGASVDIQKQYQAMQARLTQAEMLQGQADQIPAGELAKLQALFVRPPELAYLIDLLRGRLAQAGLLMTSLEVGENKGGRAGAWSMSDINISVQLKGGGYGELKNLLQGLTRAVPLLEVSSLTFHPKSASVSLNLKARRAVEEAGSPVSVDAAFFNDPRLKALQEPVSLPLVDPQGRQNPFAPFQ